MIKQDKEDKVRIQIYVACHKESYVPPNPYLYPIQVGTALAPKPLEGMLHDNEGDHISHKNKSYCELTALYWVWKNQKADYYGFFHYRRYLAFDPSLNRDDGWGNLAYDHISQRAVREMKLTPEKMREMITDYDVIGARRRSFPGIRQNGKPLTVYSEYGRASFQHRRDLDLTLKILIEKYPEFKETVTEYMSATAAYECNLFIMKHEIFQTYCQWLFDILFEAEQKMDTTWYSVEEYRVMGYLAERLCGIYLTHLRKQKEIRFGELPKTLFYDTRKKKKLEPVFEEGVPIVLSANNKFAPYLDVMIRSVVANARKTRAYDIVILHQDISEKNQRWIGKQARENQISIRFFQVSRYMDSKKLFVDQHLSAETYYRLIIPKLMPNYKKILYLDCDMVMEEDVAKLYDLDIGDNIVGAVRDIDVAGQANLWKEWAVYGKNKLHIDPIFDYFQAGVLILNLEELRKTATTKSMLLLAMSQNWRCHDQDVLNIICKNRVFYIPQRWNVLMSWEETGRSRMDIMKMAPRELFEEYLGARNQPYGIHFAGYQKPWNVADCDFADYFWKYAKDSPYYPQILKTACHVPIPMNRGRKKWTEDPSVRKLANQVLPYGSRRRELVKQSRDVLLGKRP